MRFTLFGMLILAFAVPRMAMCAEERIRGVLESTTRAGTCAQITDALKEVYYVLKTPDAEKMCKEWLGKKVVVTGHVEQRPNDSTYYINATTIELSQSKQAVNTKPVEPSKESSSPLPPPAPVAPDVPAKKE